MSDGETLYDRVDEAIERGEVWRAKEILRGNIRIRGYDVELYERYGKLLLDIGEMTEAGKYLFLSGRRASEYEDAISIYLQRHVPNPEEMYLSFPKAARLNDIDNYPEEVRRTLDSIDLPVALDGRLYALQRRREHWQKMRSKHPDLPIPTRVYLPTLSFQWKTVWPSSLRGMARHLDRYGIRPPSLLEMVITAIINLVLLMCLIVGVWVVAKWLAGHVF